MAKLRVLILISTLLIVGVIGYFASLIARGYRFDPDTFKFSANGIVVIKSDPDGAAIWINGDLKGATNTNLRLSPNTYDVEIKKDGYLTWSKRLTIKKEEVTQITAQLFRIAPSLSPITFDGASNPVAAKDFSKIAYTNNDGLWVMSVTSLPIGFPNEPKRVTDEIPANSTYTFSPNARQILLETPLGTYLLDTNEFTSQNQRVNVINTKQKILETWAEEEQKRNASLYRLVPDDLVDILDRKSKDVIFSPDETMVMYVASSEALLKPGLIPHLPGSSTQKESRDIKTDKTYIYDIKEDRNYLVSEDGRSLYWLPTSRHLIKPDENKIIVMDYDGTNSRTVFSGGYESPHAYPFVNASKLLILTNLGSGSSLSNLYSLSIK